MTAIPIPGFCEPISSITHLAAAVAALIGVIFLYRRGHGNNTRFFSLSIFSFSLVFLFSMSGVYHLLDRNTVARDVFQRLDHAAIWTLIAGTFTPIHALLFRGVWRWGFLLIIWTIAIVGLVLEVIFFTDIPEWLSLCFYLAMGWMGVLSGWKYAKEYDLAGAKSLMKGGLAYSIGAILEFFGWPVIIAGVLGPHEIFHLLIIVAASYHWYFVYERAGHPVINKLVVDVIERPNSIFIAHARGEKMTMEAPSLDAIKVQLREEIARRFPKYLLPDSVVLKLSKEDLIIL